MADDFFKDCVYCRSAGLFFRDDSSFTCLESTHSSSSSRDSFASSSADPLNRINDAHDSSLVDSPDLKSSWFNQSQKFFYYRFLMNAVSPSILRRVWLGFINPPIRYPTLCVRLPAVFHRLPSFARFPIILGMHSTKSLRSWIIPEVTSCLVIALLIGRR